jgi:predicted nucleotidyltransferase
MSEVIFHRLDHQAVIRRLRQWASEELAARPEVRDVVLFGSLAGDDWSAHSDADVVVIVDAATGRWFDRSPEYAAKSPVGIPVDLFVYTPEEAASLSPSFRSEFEHGIVLYRRRQR